MISIDKFRRKDSDKMRRHEALSRKTVKALALLLCTGMIIPFSSCKKENPDDTILPSSILPSDSAKDSGETIRAEYIRATDDFYSDQTITLNFPTDPNRELQGQFINQMAFAGDTVVVAYNQGYFLTHAEEEEYSHLNFSDPEDSARAFEIQALRTQCGLAFYNLKGESVASRKMTNQVSIVGVFDAKDGRVGVFTNEFVYDTSEGKSDKAQKHIIKLSYYSDTGDLQEEHVLGDDAPRLFGSDYAEVIPMENGNLLIHASFGLLILDPSAKVLAHVEFKQSESAIFTTDGKYYAVYTETTIKAEKNIRHTYIEEIDPNTAERKNKQETFTLDSERVLSSDGQCFTAGQRSSICRCDFIKGTVQTVIEWSNTNMAPLENVPAIKAVTDDDVYLLHMNVEGSGETAMTTGCLTHLHKEADNPYAGRKTIYVASCVEGSEDFDKLLAAYNKRPESKARVIAYIEDPGTTMEYQERLATAADKMLLNMKSGNGPDILLNCSDFCQFNSNDVLIDLNRYMDGPNGIDRSKYFDNIFRSYEVNGKLYQMPLTVTMDGLVGNPDILGQIDTWTVDGFDKKLNTLGTQVLPLLGHSHRLRTCDVSDQTGILLELLFHDMDHYVDYSNYTADFDSNDFRRLLEISKKYGSRANPDAIHALFEQYDDMFTDWQSSVMQDGLCAMRTLYISGLTSGGFSEYAELCHGNAVFLGWPSTSGKGLASTAAISVGISAYSTCPDEAWDFVSFLLSPESQITLSGVHWGGICIHKESEKAGLLKELEEYKAGKRQSDSPVYEKHIDPFLALVERIDTSIHTDPVIVNIVTEDTAAYFNGQKSAEEVSRLIQDRVSKVLAEMK